MYISENAVMMIGLGLMFMIAGFAGVFFGLLLSKLNGMARPAPVAVGPSGSLQSIRSGLAPGNWKTHVFQKVPYNTIKDAVAQLNARGFRVQSVTQADGDRYVTIYAEEWVPG